ncbi:MAG: hypothetical protein ACRC0X_01865 [Brevinema sp.]
MEESYLKTPLSTAVLNDLKKGIYHVSSLDKILFALSKDLFWKRLIKVSELSPSEFHKIREKFGYNQNSLKEGQSIFIPLKRKLNNIEIKFGKNADPSSFNSSCKPLLKEMAVHANFLGANIKYLVITSTSRTPEKQAVLMINYLTDGYKEGMYQTTRNWLYIDKQKDGNTYYEQFQKGMITQLQFEQIVEELALKHIRANLNDYAHVSDSRNVFDIGPNSSGHSRNDINCFNKTISLVEGKYLNPQTKLYGEGRRPNSDKGGEEAYHIVLR